MSGRAQVAFVPVSLRFNTATARQAFEILGLRLRYLRARLSATPPDAEGWADNIEAELMADGDDKVEAFKRVERIARGITSYYRCEALCAIAPLAPEPSALRAEVVQEAGKNYSIALMVLATDWKDEFPKQSLWELAIMKW